MRATPAACPCPLPRAVSSAFSAECLRPSLCCCRRRRQHRGCVRHGRGPSWRAAGSVPGVLHRGHAAPLGGSCSALGSSPPSPPLAPPHPPTYTHPHCAAPQLLLACVSTPRAQRLSVISGRCRLCKSRAASKVRRDSARGGRTVQRRASASGTTRKAKWEVRSIAKGAPRRAYKGRPWGLDDGRRGAAAARLGERLGHLHAQRCVLGAERSSRSLQRGLLLAAASADSFARPAPLPRRLALLALQALGLLRQQRKPSDQLCFQRRMHEQPAAP